MQQEIELAISPDHIYNEDFIIQQGVKKLKISRDTVKGIYIRKRSIDARSRQVLYRIRVVFYINEEPQIETFSSALKPVADAKPVIIIGAGQIGRASCRERVTSSVTALAID